MRMCISCRVYVQLQATAVASIRARQASVRVFYSGRSIFVRPMPRRSGGVDSRASLPRLTPESSFLHLAPIQTCKRTGLGSLGGDGGEGHGVRRLAPRSPSYLHTVQTGACTYSMAMPPSVHESRSAHRPDTATVPRPPDPTDSAHSADETARTLLRFSHSDSLTCGVEASRAAGPFAGPFELSLPLSR